MGESKEDLVESYDLKLNNIECTIDIFKSADHYFYEFESGMIVLSSAFGFDSHRVVYDSVFETLYAAIKDVCQNDEPSIKKLIREIKLEDILNEKH